MKEKNKNRICALLIIGIPLFVFVFFAISYFSKKLQIFKKQKILNICGTYFVFAFGLNGLVRYNLEIINLLAIVIWIIGGIIFYKKFMKYTLLPSINKDINIINHKYKEEIPQIQENIRKKIFFPNLKKIFPINIIIGFIMLLYLFLVVLNIVYQNTKLDIDVYLYISNGILFLQIIIFIIFCLKKNLLKTKKTLKVFYIILFAIFQTIIIFLLKQTYLTINHKIPRKVHILLASTCDQANRKLSNLKQEELSKIEWLESLLEIKRLFKQDVIKIKKTINKQILCYHCGLGGDNYYMEIWDWEKKDEETENIKIGISISTDYLESISCELVNNKFQIIYQDADLYGIIYDYIEQIFNKFNNKNQIIKTLNNNIDINLGKKNIDRALEIEHMYSLYKIQ